MTILLIKNIMYKTTITTKKHSFMFIFNEKKEKKKVYIFLIPQLRSLGI